MKVCFIGMQNLPVLLEDGSDDFGGEAVQQTLIARECLKNNISVSMITFKYGGEKKVDDVDIHDVINNRRSGVLGRLADIVGFVKALNKSKADIYYYSCAGYLLFLLALYCRFFKKVSVFRVAHDTDLIPGSEIISSKSDRFLYRLGLKMVDYVCFQTDSQVKLAKDNYPTLSGSILPMLVERGCNTAQSDIDVLWINNIRSFKRPLLFVDLAKRMPAYNFVMIGGCIEKDLYSILEKEAAEVKNLEFLGSVPYHNVNSYIERCRVFVNTSESEGFPNSYLQSFIRGKPVVSFFDPDGHISRYNMGAAISSLSEMELKLEELLDSKGFYNEVSNNALEYASGKYASDSAFDSYYRVFKDLMHGK